MDNADKGQLAGGAADVYEEFFVPALFGEWCPRVSKAAALAPGHSVLDVACGTGVLARDAATRVGPGGAVVGLDVNQSMLEVARRTSSAIEWKSGQAESLPFEDARFDAVVSQFGLMFFEDRDAALREMWRVLRPGGRLAVAVWGSLESSPGYSAMTVLLQRLFGDQAANAFRAPFVLGDSEPLLALFTDAGIPGAEVLTQEGTARFPSIESWTYTDIKGWTLADVIDDSQYACLLAAAHEEFTTFVQGDGSVAFSVSAHIVSATRPVTSRGLV